MTRALALAFLFSAAAFAQSPNLIWESSPGGGPVAFFPDGKTLAVGAGVNLELVSASAGQVIRSNRLFYSGSVISLAVSPNGATLAVGTSGTSRNLQFVRVSDGALLWSATAHANGTKGVAFSPDGSKLASTGPDRTTKLWRTSDGALLSTFNDGVRQLAVAYSPDGTLVASGNAGGFHLWRTSDGALLQSIAGAAATLAFSPDGKSIATAAALYNISGAELRSFPNPYPDSSGICVAFTHDGTKLLIGSEDFSYPSVDVGAIRVWNPATGALVATYTQATGEMVNAISVSPDNSEFAYSFSDPRAPSSNLALAHTP